MVCNSTPLPVPFELIRGLLLLLLSLGISSNLLERNLLVPLRLVHDAQIEKYSSRPTARRKDLIKDALAMMMASSGSKTVHRSPIGRVKVGSVKEMSINEKMRMMEMAVTLGEVNVSKEFHQKNIKDRQEPTILLFQRYPQVLPAGRRASAASRCWAWATASQEDPCPRSEIQQ